MKARTKFQLRIVNDISSKLKPISKKQINWAIKTGFPCEGYRTKTKGTTCMECATVFHTDKEKCTCPGCGKKLNIVDTKKKLAQNQITISIIEVVEEFQIMRYFSFIRYYSKGEKVRVAYIESCRNFLTDDNVITTMSRLMYVGYGYSIDKLMWSSALEIRNYRLEYHDMYPDYVYPNPTIRPIYQQRGLGSDFFDIRPLFMFRSLLTNNKIETLLKTGQTSLIEFQCYKNNIDFKLFWPTIRICMRNNYIIKDANMWFDYINFLIKFKKDILNPKYVCPVDLKLEHDYYMNKNFLIVKGPGLKILAKKAVIYSDLLITDGNIEVVPLRTLQEYQEEGIGLKHCVFKSSYYDRPKSLILSARIDSKRIETVEVSLETFKVVQCHGWDNQNSVHHSKIVELVNNNGNIIRKLTKKAI